MISSSLGGMEAFSCVGRAGVPARRFPGRSPPTSCRRTESCPVAISYSTGQARTGRCVHQGRRRAPARATCRRPCQQLFPACVSCAPAIVVASPPTVSIAGLAIARQFGQAEVQDLRLPASRHEDIRRLQVAVDDAFGMRNVQRVRNLDADVEDLVERQRNGRRSSRSGSRPPATPWR